MLHEMRLSTLKKMHVSQNPKELAGNALEEDLNNGIKNQARQLA